MTIDEMKANVEAGILLLDQEIPDWRRGIDPDNLSMELCEDCILGQIYGFFDTGCAQLGLSLADAERLGFYLNDYDATPDNHSLLDALWIEALS